MQPTKLTVTQAERQDMPYIWEGTKFQIKIVDLNKLIILIREKRELLHLSNIIQIVPKQVHKYHEPIFKGTYVKDDITGIFYGIRIGWHPDGNPMWQKIQINEAATLDLNKDPECRIWAVLRMHPKINVSPFATDESVQWIVVNPEIQANEILGRGTLISSVLAKIKKMPKENMRHFARYISIPLQGTESNNQVRARLVEFGLAEPERFQESFEDTKRPIGEIFRSAKTIGLIQFDNETGYKYQKVFLGLTDYKCFETLAKETSILESMRRAVQVRDEEAAKNIISNEDE